MLILCFLSLDQMIFGDPFQLLLTFYDFSQRYREEIKQNYCTDINQIPCNTKQK